MERIKITNGTLTAEIHPHGAELQSLKDNSNTEYMWEGNPEIWGKHSPVLFPIVGTLKNNTYLYNGTTYALPRHGFARDNVFSLKAHTESSAIFSLIQNDETRRVYPFDFEFEMHYTFSGNILNIDYVVKNIGNDVMPFSLGAHPAFALPGKFSDYSLEFEKQEKPISFRLKGGLVSDETFSLPVAERQLPLDYRLFERDALIFKSLESKTIAINKNHNPVLKVSFEKFPHMGIWAIKDAPFICIEPWHGYSDAYSATGNIKDKEGVVFLEPGNEHKTGFSIEILR